MINEVKNLEIYRMPDGNDYYAARAQHGAYFLYPIETRTLPPTYEITTDGQIKKWETNEDCYTLDQMTDTGRKIDCDQEDRQPSSLFSMMINDFYYGGKTSSK